MARYVFSCDSCQHRFEIDRPMAQAGDPENCPACGAQARRVFTAPGITIKGAPIKFKSGEELERKSNCEGCSHEGCQFNH